MRVDDTFGTQAFVHIAMETTGLLTEPAPQRVRSAAPVAIATAVSTIGCALLLLSSRSSSGVTSAGTASLTFKTGVHFHFQDTSPSYGALVGDDLIQKNWGGLTCARTDDDKWGWGQDDISGETNNDTVTSCTWGDTQFCIEHYKKESDGTLSEMPDLLWQYCNSSCNGTDERRYDAYSSEATMEGSSLLFACAVGGIKKMRDVCADNKVWTEQYKTSRRAMAVADPSTTHHFNRNDWHLQHRVLKNYDNPPSVPNRESTYIYINGSNHTQYQQAGCNTHGLCGECVASNGTIDKYCEAFLQYYDVNQQFKEHQSRFHDYDPENFWCVPQRNMCNVALGKNETILIAIGTTSISGATKRFSTRSRTGPSRRSSLTVTSRMRFKWSSPTVMTKNSRCGARPTRRSTKASLTTRRGVINRNRNPPDLPSSTIYHKQKRRRRKNHTQNCRA